MARKSSNVAKSQKLSKNTKTFTNEKLSKSQKLSKKEDLDVDVDTDNVIEDDIEVVSSTTTYVDKDKEEAKQKIDILLNDKEYSDAYLEVMRNKQEENEKIAKVEQAARNTGKEIEIYVGKARERKKTRALRLAFHTSNYRLGTDATKVLLSLANLSKEELSDFIKYNNSTLTVKEIAAIQILMGVIAKDPEATKMYWQLVSKYVPNDSGSKITSTTNSNNIHTKLDEIAEAALGKHNI